MPGGEEDGKREPDTTAGSTLADTPALRLVVRVAVMKFYGGNWPLLDSLPVKVRDAKGGFVTGWTLNRPVDRESILEVGTTPAHFAFHDLVGNPDPNADLFAASAVMDFLVRTAIMGAPKDWALVRRMRKLTGGTDHRRGAVVRELERLVGEFNDAHSTCSPKDVRSSLDELWCRRADAVAGSLEAGRAAIEAACKAGPPDLKDFPREIFAELMATERRLTDFDGKQIEVAIERRRTVDEALLTMSSAELRQQLLCATTIVRLSRQDPRLAWIEVDELRAYVPRAIAKRIKVNGIAAKLSVSVGAFNDGVKGDHKTKRECKDAENKAVKTATENFRRGAVAIAGRRC